MTINNGQTQRHRQHWSQDTVERQTKPEITNNNGQPKDTCWSQDTEDKPNKKDTTEKIKKMSQ